MHTLASSGNSGHRDVQSHTLSGETSHGQGHHRRTSRPTGSTDMPVTSRPQQSIPGLEQRVVAEHERDRNDAELPDSEHQTPVPHAWHRRQHTRDQQPNVQALPAGGTGFDVAVGEPYLVETGRTAPGSASGCSSSGCCWACCRHPPPSTVGLPRSPCDGSTVCCQKPAGCRTCR